AAVRRLAARHLPRQAPSGGPTILGDRFLTESLMPRLSDAMEEGVISSWQKQPGDEIEVGDVIVDIETDKAVMEFEAYEAGVLKESLVTEVESAAFGSPIAMITPAVGE